ncbi:MAG: DUF1700 domain-containing protein [Eubacteriales bacterium]
MNKYEFLNELEQLLNAISFEEKEEALQYYRDYFEDAGLENEEDVIRALGTPGQVAGNISSGLSDENREKGEFNETGFEGYYAEPKSEVQNIKTISKFNSAMLILLIIAGVFISPFLGAVGSGVLGIFSTIVIIVICIIFGTAIAGIAIIVVGTMLLLAGITTMISSFYGGVCIVGAGFFLLGLGILLTMLGVKIITVIVPWIVGKIVKVCKLPFFKKDVGC